MGNLIKSCNIGSSSGNRSIPSTNIHLSKDKQQPPIVGKGTTHNGSDEIKKLINENGSAISPKHQSTADDLQESSQSLLKDAVADDFKDESSSTPTVTAAADSDLLSTIASSSCDMHVTYQSSVKQVYQRRKSTAALTGAIPPIDFPRIKLLPHEHTLFCERKQRVCTAVGKLQEMEVLKIDGLNLIPGGFTWIRIHPSISVGDNDVDSAVRCHSIDAVRSDSSLYSTILGSDNLEQYVLTRDDVGCFIGISYQISTHSAPPPPQITGTVLSTGQPHCSDSLISDEANDPQITRQFLLSEEYGLVLPGPPRLVEFTIEGGESMEVGTYAMAKTNYIGGFEGASEYWWMRVGADGRRTQVTEPKKISVHPSSGRCLSCGGAGDQSLFMKHTSNPVDTVAPADYVIISKDNDPRYYKLNEADRGCYLKAKCRPTRTDGVQGEIFTSKSSLIVS